jgi:hypothetical protein
MLQTINEMQATSGALHTKSPAMTHSFCSAAWHSFSHAEKRHAVINAVARFIDLVTSGHEQEKNMRLGT